MSVMIRCTRASEGQTPRVDAWAETLASVGARRLERMRHQCQWWARAKVYFALAMLNDDGFTHP